MIMPGTKTLGEMNTSSSSNQPKEDESSALQMWEKKVDTDRKIQARKTGRDLPVLKVGQPVLVEDVLARKHSGPEAAVSISFWTGHMPRRLFPAMKPCTWVTATYREAMQ